jgi:hypothetical protein
MSDAAMTQSARDKPLDRELLRFAEAGFQSWLPVSPATGKARLAPNFCTAEAVEKFGNQSRGKAQLTNRGEQTLQTT